MARYLELRLSDRQRSRRPHRGGPTGAPDLLATHRAYALLVSSGAQRATQTLACFACALAEPVSGGVIVEPGLRSSVEERWFAAYRAAGSGELFAWREVDHELVREDAARFAAGLRRVLDRLPDGARALAVGHSPTNEAAVYGLTGEIVAPMSKGAGVLVIAAGDHARAEPHR